MVNTINPADCKPGEVYEGTVHGVERTVLIRRDACDSYPWESLGEVLDHEDVSSLVRLVPAREVTRDDLPDFGAMASVMARWKVSYGAVSDVLDAVVSHLNANGGLPASSDGVYGIPREDYEYVDWPATCAAEIERADRAETDRDRWRRAHAIVEQERDQARESLRRLRDETDFDLFTVRDQLKQCRGEREQMTRDSDEAVARAEAAERERATAFPLHQPDGTHMDASHLPIGANDDPAVFVVRESDVAAVKVTEAGQRWRAGETGIPLQWKANKVREKRDECATEWVELEAIARAIEAEPVDPVEELAGQIEAATRTAIRQVCDDLAAVAPSLDPLTVEQVMEVTSASRKVAAHVLGQETGQ